MKVFIHNNSNVNLKNSLEAYSSLIIFRNIICSASLFISSHIKYRNSVSNLLSELELWTVKAGAVIARVSGWGWRVYFVSCHPHVACGGHVAAPLTLLTLLSEWRGKWTCHIVLNSSPSGTEYACHPILRHISAFTTPKSQILFINCLSCTFFFFCCNSQSRSMQLNSLGQSSYSDKQVIGSEVKWS